MVKKKRILSKILATPHKIKVTVSLPFLVDLDVGLYVLPAFTKNNYRYVLEAILRKNVKKRKITVMSL